MSRPCTVCDHPEVADINAAIATGSASFRDAARLNGLSKDAVARHARDHVPRHLAKAHRAAEAAEATTLLQKLEDLEAEARHLLALAKEKAEAEDGGARELQAAAALLREARSTLELLAKLTGELVERREVRVTHEREDDPGEVLVAMVEFLECHRRDLPEGPRRTLVGALLLADDQEDAALSDGEAAQ